MRFFALHDGPLPLVLPAAWDAGSARALERAGASAIALDARAIAWSHGYDAATELRVDELLAVCERVCATVAIPVSLDLRGWPLDRGDTHAYTDCGVAGVTLDASTAEDVACVVDQAADAGLFIEAHVAGGYAHVRGLAHDLVDAGVHGILVTECNAADIVAVARELPVPLAIDVGDGWAPSIHMLARAGVRRVCLGRGPFVASMAVLQAVADEAIARGSYDLMNRWLSR